MQKPDCIFCKIATGEIPSYKIYEDDKLISFLDIAPAHEGHCLIIPKQHFDDLLDMDDATAATFLPVAKKIILVMEKALKADGYNLIQNNRDESGQEVMHYHLHIIPRYKGRGSHGVKDAMHPKGYTYKPDKRQLEETTAKIRAELIKK